MTNGGDDLAATTAARPHMMKRRGVLALLIAGAAMSLTGCGAAGEELPIYRYRLTVEVETPEGLKTGSSVIEVRTMIAGRNSIPTPGAIGRRARGEAVTVELGAHGTLFAILRSEENRGDWASGVMFGFAPDLPLTRDKDGKFDSSAHTKARFMAMLENRDLIEVPGQRVSGSRKTKEGVARPMLVRFADIADPTSVERVDPDDMAALFGQGVKLRRITVQLTDDPVTTGIGKKLSWLSNQRGSLIPIPRGKAVGEMPIGSSITEGDFIRGEMDAR